MPIASPLYTIEIRSRYSIVTGLLDFFPSRWPILSCSDPRMPIVSPFPPLRYAANTPGLMAWQRRYVKVAPGHMEKRFDRLNQLLTSVIQRFQQYQFPCNWGVLTTGFDAPQVTHIRMAHTTVSRVMYDQIVGLGLRGPEFGGTESCVNLTAWTISRETARSQAMNWHGTEGKERNVVTGKGSRILPGKLANLV